MDAQDWAVVHRQDDPHPMSGGQRAARYRACVTWGHIGLRGKRVVSESSCVRCNPWLAPEPPAQGTLL